MKNFSLILFFFTSMASISLGQSINKSEVVKAKEITFYGYDYTHFKILDAKRMNQDINKYIFMWIEFCNVRVNENKLSKMLKKDKIIFNEEPTIELNKKLISSNLVSITKKSISKDSIQKYVNNYNITEKDGVGFVIIIESFDNQNKSVSAYYTFFDIATKKVLLSDYFISRDGNSYNRVLDWGAAVVIALNKYTKIYRKN